MNGDTDLLTPLEAARHLGITPELLTAYARPSFRKRPGDARPLRSISVHGRIRYSRSDLDAFDAYLQQPWADGGNERPAVPGAIIKHLVAESLNQCARCGSGFAVQTAHIESWASTHSHHHHNLLRLCVACHNAHDSDGIISTDELRGLKESLIARSRASLDRRLEGSADRFRPPRRSTAFHGRSLELNAVVTALQEGRSVMISGAGGMGKTELLLQALERAETGRPVIWIDVERFRDAAAVEKALHIVLSFDDSPLATEHLAVRLDEMNACVVLDGVEQGNLTDLETLERWISELSSSSLVTQFVATSQVRLHRFPADETIVVGPLDDAASELILGGSGALPPRPVGRSSEMLCICAGHALTLKLASALIAHFGTVTAATRVVKQRGAMAVSMPGVSEHDRSTSLSVCLAIAFDALSPAERKSLLLIALAPAGLFAAQLEDDFFEIGSSVDALARLRRWHLVSSDGDPVRERVHTLSPIRMFTTQRFAEDDPHEAETLKSELLASIGIMVGVIEDRSSESDQIDYMVARYSEDLPNILWLLAEAEATPSNSQIVLLALATCSSLMRYFFVLKLSEEGALLMQRAAELAIASGRYGRAAAFVVQLVGLRRRQAVGLVDIAEHLMARIESSGRLPLRGRGDLQVARAMIALDDGDPTTAAEWARTAFESYTKVMRLVGQQRENDQDECAELTHDPVGAHQEELHNDIAAALRLHGDAMLGKGDYDRAGTHYRNSLKHQRGASIAVNRGQIMHQIGNCECHLGNHEVAARCYFEAIAIFYAVGMRGFLSNATGELGMILLDCDPPELRELPDSVFAAALQDLTTEFAECADLSRGLFPQRCVELARKTFGTLNACMMTSRVTMAKDWAFRVSTDMIVPMINAAPADGGGGQDVRFSGMMLQTPLEITFMVADLEDSRDGNGDPGEGLLCELLAMCCSIDVWTRNVLRLPDWLATYLARRFGVTSLTRERVAEFMMNCDDGVQDELDLQRADR